MLPGYPYPEAIDKKINYNHTDRAYGGKEWMVYIKFMPEKKDSQINNQHNTGYHSFLIHIWCYLVTIFISLSKLEAPAYLSITQSTYLISTQTDLQYPSL